MMLNEPIPVAEAADQLLGFVKHIRGLDDEFELLMRRKADAYRTVKRSGFQKEIVKALVRDLTVADDVELLRRYLALLIGDEAARAMKDQNDFGRVLFGEADSWPADFVDAKHGPEGFPRG